MTPATLLELALLGSCLAGPKTLSQLIEAARGLGGTRWQPTTDLIRDGALELAARGLLERDGDALAITEPGRRRLEQLLRAPDRRPLDELSALARSVRACLSPTLEPALRGEVLRSVLSGYQEAIGHLDQARRRSRSSEPLLAQALARDLERLAAEMRWAASLITGA